MLLFNLLFIYLAHQNMENTFYYFERISDVLIVNFNNVVELKDTQILKRKELIHKEIKSKFKDMIKSPLIKKQIKKIINQMVQNQKKNIRCDINLLKLYNDVIFKVANIFLGLDNFVKDTMTVNIIRIFYKICDEIYNSIKNINVDINIPFLERMYILYNINSIIKETIKKL